MTDQTSTKDAWKTDAQVDHDLDRRHVFHSWSAQAKLDPMVVSRAEGSHVWDGEGRKYLDFTSQLVFTNIGHQHPRVVAAIQEQAARLCTVAPSHANGARSEAARLITAQLPDGLERIFFTNGGADANEHAVRMARLHTGRHKVLSRYRSYHGGTHLAINLTGDPRRWANDNATSGTVHFFGPFLYRSEFHATTEAQECERALAHLEQVIALEGPDTIAAIILESVPGTAGIMVPPPGYLTGVRELCDRHGIILIADEVMAGFGRTGRWFGFELDGVVPDLVTFAKGVNSGYVPLGGVAISEPIYQTFADRPYPGGLTYSGHPLACAAAVATIETMHDEQIVEHADMLGSRGARSRSPGARRPSRLDRRGARHRRLLGAGPRLRPGDPGAVRAVRREQSAAGRGARSFQGGRSAAVRELQPDPRRAAAEHQRGGRPYGPRHAVPSPGEGPRPVLNQTRHMTPAERPPVILFDLDGVLAREDTFSVFVRRQLRARAWRIPLAAPALPALAVTGELPTLRGLLARHVVRVALLGLSLEEATAALGALGREFAATPAWLYRDGIDCAREHLDEGHRVIVVTASERHLARALLDGAGLEGAELFASDLTQRRGGLELSPHNYGARKGQSLEAAGIERPWQRMYSDSVADLPTLRATQEQVLVNPSRAARQRLTRLFPETLSVASWN